MSDLVGNPEDRFSRVEAHIVQLHVYPVSLRNLAHAIYRHFFSEAKNEKFIGKSLKLKYFGLKYTLWLHINTHNVCFGSKIRK